MHTINVPNIVNGTELGIGCSKLARIVTNGRMYPVSLSNPYYNIYEIYQMLGIELNL